MKERVQKLMSQLGIASRRTAEDMITNGRVRINGKLAKLGDQADPAVDVVEVDGRRLKIDASPAKIYIAIHKPKGVITTNSGHRGDHRQTIRELVPHEGHLFTIGRLDVDSEGLVVLTNDGEMAQKLSHPRYQHTKTYKVVVQGLPTAVAVEKWQRGLMLEEGMTAPASVQIVKGATDFSTLRIVMTEGKKRQIRRVALILGHPVKRLVRTRIGMLDLGTLKPGEWRELTPRDVEELKTVAPELKSIKQLGRRSRSGPGRGYDPEAKMGRRGGRPLPEPRGEDVASDRPPRGFSVDEGAPGGYQSDRKPMRRIRPGGPNAAPAYAESRPYRRPEGDAGAPKRDDDRKPPRRGRPSDAPSAPTQGRTGRPPRRSKDGDAAETTRNSDRKPMRGGRPGAKRGRPAPNNPGAVRRPRPAKRGPKGSSGS